MTVTRADIKQRNFLVTQVIFVDIDIDWRIIDFFAIFHHGEVCVWLVLIVPWNFHIGASYRMACHPKFK